jgi:hypothetical protein
MRGVSGKWIKEWMEKLLINLKRKEWGHKGKNELREY